MPNKTTATAKQLIEQFALDVGEYLRWTSARDLQAPLLETHHHDEVVHRIVDCENRRMDARAAVLATGPKLARVLESAGHDATTVLKLIHAADGYGPAAVSKLWLDAQAFLERAAMVGDRPSTTATTKRPPKGEWLARAMLTVKDHPEWSDRRIAEEIGVSPGTLSRDKLYQAASRLARDTRRAPRGGFTTTDDDALSDIEAIDG